MAAAETLSAKTQTKRRRRLYSIYAALAALVLAQSAISDWRQRHGLLINATTSLPNWAFWLDRTRTPKRGDYVFFNATVTPLVRAHFGETPGLFGKRIYGVPGDRVSRRGQNFFVNGIFAATAKLHSRTGAPLSPGPDGIVPPGHYFVATPHPDGFDSRYADIGWVSRRQIVGVGTPIL